MPTDGTTYKSSAEIANWVREWHATEVRKRAEQYRRFRGSLWHGGNVPEEFKPITFEDLAVAIEKWDV